MGMFRPNAGRKRVTIAAAGPDESVTMWKEEKGALIMHRFIVAALAALVLAGCVATVRPGTPGWRAVTTRHYQVPRETVFAAAQRYMLSQGWQITSGDISTGTLVGRGSGGLGLTAHTWTVLLQPDSTGTIASVSMQAGYADGSMQETETEVPRYERFWQGLEAELRPVR